MKAWPTVALPINNSFRGSSYSVAASTALAGRELGQVQLPTLGGTTIEQLPPLGLCTEKSQ